MAIWAAIVLAFFGLRLRGHRHVTFAAAERALLEQLWSRREEGGRAPDVSTSRTRPVIAVRGTLRCTCSS